MAPAVTNYVPKHAMKSTEVQIAQAEAPELPYVNWRKDKGLRKLYAYCIIICVASATTGYDGLVIPFVCCRLQTANLQILLTMGGLDPC